MSVCRLEPAKSTSTVCTKQDRFISNQIDRIAIYINVVCALPYLPTTRSQPLSESNDILLWSSSSCLCLFRIWYVNYLISHYYIPSGKDDGSALVYVPASADYHNGSGNPPFRTFQNTIIVTFMEPYCKVCLLQFNQKYLNSPSRNLNFPESSLTLAGQTVCPCGLYHLSRQLWVAGSRTGSS